MQEALRVAALKQRDDLFRTFMELGGRSQHDDLSDLPKYETEALATQCSAYIDRWSGTDSAYRQSAQGQVDRPVHVRLPVLLGIVKGLGTDIEQGWLSSLEELVHADTFVDLLDQASELQSKGFKDAAAVIAGSVLESHLKALSAKLGIPLSTPSGDPKKASVLNADLKKTGAYNGAVEKQVTAWLGIRNHAAHGEYAEYDHRQVVGLIRDVTDFVAANPA